MRRLSRAILLPRQRWGNRAFSSIGGDLIPVVNKLQEVFAVGNQSFDLPQICVVGSQSSGKSSVIEGLVGKDFLPRGRGVVTRVPLILQLQALKEGEEEYATFSHDSKLRGKKFSDFDDVRRMIAEETSRIAGKSNIVNSPILLKVFSKSAVPITLVDTPGLTRVAVRGQPDNIKHKIVDMVSSFIKEKSSVILAVTPANQDIATSDALRLAKKFDPSGSRTVGVLTKLDLMDKGTDAMDILTGRTYPLGLGFVGVVNRSQSDIDKGTRVSEAYKEEEAFFKNHEKYGSIAGSEGTKVLQKKLNEILLSQIRGAFPGLKESIRRQLDETQASLTRIGVDSPPTDASQRGYLLLRLLTNFASRYCAAIDGAMDAGAGKSLSGGARIRHLFNEVFEQRMRKIDALEGLQMEDFRMAIRNAAGAKPSLFLPEMSFEILAKGQIQKLEAPALDCCHEVAGELARIMVGTKEGSQYAALSERIVESGTRLLKEKSGPTAALIRHIVQAECDYINTNHPDFVGLQILADPKRFARRDATSPPSSPPQAKSNRGFFSKLFGSTDNASQPSFDESELPSTPSDREMMQVALLKTLLDSYFDIARKNVQDITVKLIWSNLVLESRTELQKRLLKDLYKDNLFDELLVENPNVARDRKEWREKLVVLKNAKDIVQEAEMSKEFWK